MIFSPFIQSTKHTMKSVAAVLLLLVAVAAADYKKGGYKKYSSGYGSRWNSYHYPGYGAGYGDGLRGYYGGYYGDNDGYYNGLYGINGGYYNGYYGDNDRYYNGIYGDDDGYYGGILSGSRFGTGSLINSLLSGRSNFVNTQYYSGLPLGYANRYSLGSVYGNGLYGAPGLRYRSFGYRPRGGLFRTKKLVSKLHRTQMEMKN